MTYQPGRTEISVSLTQEEWRIVLSGLDREARQEDLLSEAAAAATALRWKIARRVCGVQKEADRNTSASEPLKP